MVFSQLVFACLVVANALVTTSGFVLTTSSRPSALQPVREVALVKTAQAYQRKSRSPRTWRAVEDDAVAAAQDKVKQLQEQADDLRKDAASRVEDVSRDASDKLDSAAGAAQDAASSEGKQERAQEISSDMKKRLTRELEAQGANPNKSAGNPILIISGVIALLVVLGGKGEMTHNHTIMS